MSRTEANLAGHTPLLWYVEKTALGLPVHILAKQGPLTVGPALVTNAPDARLIVKCVNRDPLFEEMLKALEHATHALHALASDPVPSKIQMLEHQLDAILSRARSVQP